MARNGLGTYTLPSGNPVVTGTPIASAWANTTLSDIAAELTNSLPRDGQASPTANIPMGGFKITGLPASIPASDNASDAATVGSPNFIGIPTAPTAAFGASGAQLATLDFVNAVAFASILPGQTSNSGKFLSTNGTNASWQWNLGAIPIGAMVGNYSTAATTITYQGAVYLRTGNLGSIVTYPNAPQNTYIQATVLPNSRAWTAVAYGNGVYVTLASSTAIGAYSVDGITWAESTLPSSSVWSNVAFGANLFVAIAASGTSYATSPDGITWTGRTFPGSSAVYKSIVFGGGKFVVLDQTTISLVSATGTSWTTGTLPSSQTWNGVAYGAGLYVAVATSSNISATSNDGQTWLAGTIPTSGYSTITYGATHFAILGTTGAAAYSTNGTSWTATSSPTGFNWDLMAYGNGVMVGITNTGASQSITTSHDDGLTWVKRPLPQSGTWNGIGYGNSKFVGVGLSSTKGWVSDLLIYTDTGTALYLDTNQQFPVYTRVA